MIQSPKRRYRFRDYLSPKVLVMLALGFSSGLPFLLVGNTFGFWLQYPISPTRQILPFTGPKPPAISMSLARATSLMSPLASGSRLNGATDQPTSTWPDMVCVMVAEMSPVATARALSP